MSSRRQKLLARINWYLQSSLKHITELITGNKSYYRGSRYRQVSLYNILEAIQAIKTHVRCTLNQHQFRRVKGTYWRLVQTYWSTSWLFPILHSCNKRGKPCIAPSGSRPYNWLHLGNSNTPARVNKTGHDKSALTHIWLNKMAAISQTTFSRVFSWMKMSEFLSKFRWNLFLRVHLTICGHWLR